MQLRDRRAFMAALGAGLAALPTLGHSQPAAWPARPVKLIVPAAAGGASDRLGRMLAPDFLKALGQPLVVENRAGAGSTLGTSVVASAAPDGYTLLLSGVFNSIGAGLYKLKYDFLKDFIQVAPLAFGPNVLVARPEFPADSLAQLVARAKAEPGAINFASGGVGTSGHLTMEMFQHAAHIRFTHVAYKGGAPALQDVLAGVTPLMAINQDAALPYIKAGKLKALAVSSAQRNPAYPNVPTFVESGYSDVVAMSWGGVAVPRGTPAPVVEKLRAVVQAALQRPEIRAALEADGWVVASMAPAEFDAFVRNDTARMLRIIRDSNVSAE
ncbi:MAG: tripartite tricarboxylate transporter substrate binding protein [Comamonas sp.]